MGLGYTNPYLIAVRGIPALQDASGDPRVSRRRQAHRPTARGRSPRAACSRCRSSSFPAARSSATMPVSSTRRASRAATRRSSPACSRPTPRSTRSHAGRERDELAAYPAAFEASWLHDELYRARNFKPWMSKGLYLGTADGRHRPDRVPRQGAVDAAPPALPTTRRSSRRRSASRSTIRSPTACSPSTGSRRCSSPTRTTRRTSRRT